MKYIVLYNPDRIFKSEVGKLIKWLGDNYIALPCFEMSHPINFEEVPEELEKDK